MGKLKALAVTRVGMGMHADGDGLYLQVRRGDARSWIYRYTLNGRERYLGLGSAKAINLKEARELAQEARALRAKKIDPIEQRNKERLAARIESAKAITFAQCTRDYITAHEAGWRSAKHVGQWNSTLETYAWPVIGHLAVRDIDTDLVVRIIAPLWSSKTETASRLRGRIEAVLDWAAAREYRDGPNPARWRGHLDKLLPSKSKVHKTEHFAALPYAEIPAFMAELRKHQSTSARCLEFLILTAGRTNEAIGARWSEINFKDTTWSIPAARMKAQQDHRVPLSPRAVAILLEQSARRESEFVFPGMKGGRPLSSMALLTQLEGRSVTVHGFRSTFTDWAHECTDFSDIVIDMALAHKVSDKVQAAYRRGDLFEKRRRLMQDWANYCSRPAFEGDVMPTRHNISTAP
jgi:integrase